MITIVDSEAEEGYPVKVVDLEDDALVLTAPYDHNGYPILLTPGSRVIIGYVHTAYFSFETSVREQIAGRTPLIIVEKPQPSQISKEQRRQSFRVPVTLRARVTTNHTDWFEVNLLDLSAGGFRAAMTHARLHIGDELAGELTLPLERGAATVSFEGEVTREGVAGDMVVLGVQFQQVHPSDEALIRYCMEHQRRFLRTKRDEFDAARLSKE
ncbi:flagellar brake protein [Alicyclobacillus acidoterrestris]|uniref:flagellar brake protein n=1 Tax=Alicyclobacillus acidoterrestris TaxID=1450 RepID=UPI0013784B7C|nr:PilZ domain-containing protein [Alicyclobacillus acidoterrestris]